MKILIAVLAALTLSWTCLESPIERRAAAAGDVQDQINKTLTLSPATDVRVSGFNGSVKIETWDGDRAEINIQVKASDREAMDRRPVVIEHTGNTLVIRTENDREGGKWGRDHGWVRHDVNLRLPRAVSLKVSSINGSVNAGQITGAVAVSSVNGSVQIAQAGTATTLTSINGRVSVSVGRIGEGGLRVSSVNGGVEIGLPQSTNADVEVRSVNGGINTDIPINILGEMKRGQLTGKLGSGGARIEVNSINGGVTLRGN
ncbi:MAG TPA: DUF4097 family beta strand repeat-containing protein [Blastocatellia bacterium]|nr:DUF4097 family beta strand repeat-containing protein [Blastocatellia bacterium]HMV85286.1 DUF4097 family beta strand repeat-containing protein [Blastocatellia bacterium]HMX26378.1 DUF4097 family beta strand repeat-containing protein [Blastocatellia bacterium]HMY71215.1 DUF4097 family beta strand repeat-containing protein [Blastocatellia bacterium]HMZ17658.1 DUF4097 family beta strand repeat-containing protein [Blastocatellia bacterium]